MNFSDMMKQDITNSGPNVVKEEHDSNKIDISNATDNARAGTLSRRRDASNRGEGWDAYEYGMSETEAVRLATTEEGRQQIRESAKARADLDDSTGKVAMLSALQPAWHGLGVQIDRAVDGQQAIEFASLAGWGLRKHEHRVDVTLGPGVPMEDGDRVMHSDMEAQVVSRPSGNYAIVRGDTGAVIGKSVGSQYEIFENEQLADLVDAVLDFGAEVITAGSLGKGERVWILAKMPETATVAEGDTLEQYILFVNAHDGSGAIKVMPTSVRVECANTMPNTRGRRGISIRHTKNAKQRVAEVKRALGLAVQEFDEFADMARELAAAEMTVSPESFFDDVLDQALTSNVAGERVTSAKILDGTIRKAIGSVVNEELRDAELKKFDRHLKRRASLMDDMLARFANERCNGKESISGSIWAAVNAVTENLDHSPLWQLNNPESTRQNRAESRFDSLLTGTAADLTEYTLSAAKALLN